MSESSLMLTRDPTDLDTLSEGFYFDHKVKIDDSLVHTTALTLFLGLKELLLLHKLSGPERPDQVDGQVFQRHFCPAYRGYPYYWLRRPFIDAALIILTKKQLISRGNKGFINGTGADELFGLGSLGLNIIQEEKTTELISQRVDQVLIDAQSKIS